MKWNLKSLLKNKTTLYVVLFFAVTNLFGYLMTHNYNAVIFMLAVGLVASNFSKNMIVVLGIAIVATSFFVGSGSIMEGMAPDTSSVPGKGKKGKGKKGKGKKGTDTEPMRTLNPKRLDDESDGEDGVVKASDEAEQKGATGSKENSIDYAATLENAYDNLDNLLSSDAINKMGDETVRLGDKQKKLMKNIDKLEPMMMKATSLMDKFDMDGMMGKMNSMMSKFGGAAPAAAAAASEEEEK
tara:strand:- start:18 stop:740 length:723 start_codon:yes stop_codon:yes gene_type:complete